MPPKRPKAVVFEVEEGEEVEEGFGDFGGFEDDGEDEEATEERKREERRKRRKQIEARHGGAGDVKPATHAQLSSGRPPVAVSHPGDPRTQAAPTPAPVPVPATAGVGAENGAESGAGDGGGFDMFSESPTGAMAGLEGRAVTREVIEQGDLENLQDNWDDGEGYYNARPGEVIADSYRILGSIGKGVFSTVLECVDLRTGQLDKRVAIKLIRNVDIMRKAAEKEVSILTALRTGDGKGGARDDKYCVAFLGHLEHRRHTVLVFEMMRMNLRETVKKYGSGEGINVSAVRLYAKQLFVALAHMASHGVVHADIKPDNILVSEDLKVVKICDFGSAFRTREPNAADPTPYLVSRFYRAPEIVLGLPYDGRLDLWSVATCIYEAFTGKVMFPGSSNNDMLRRMMAVMGPFPAKLLRAHQRSYDKLELESHFTDDLQFKHVDLDKVTARPVMRVMRIAEPTKSALAHLADVDVADVGVADRPILAQVDDLLGKCLQLDPKRRLSLELCSTHPLFKL